MKIRQVIPADLEAAYKIEASNFSPEEAASYEAVKSRIAKIPDTFLVAEIGSLSNRVGK